MNFFRCTDHAAYRYQMRVNRKISFPDAKNRVEKEVENNCDLWGNDGKVQIFRHRLCNRRFMVKGRKVLTVELC